MHPEGKEEGSICNRPIEFIADFGTAMEQRTASHCEGTMVLKVKDHGPGNQEAYLECSECLATWPE